ncbi:hypothetical protein [Skermanella pratensis]|uniref:hypothetical protein n=1 Tax=Skermanella pratensis TaxID=2233999 RepID=UPI00130104D8|nr:hypothetical protein [Skermanella pratensis]
MGTPNGVSNISEMGRERASDKATEIGPGRQPPKMTFLQGIGFFVAAYLALLARSAWKQGEIRQFLMSCLVLAGLFGVLGAVIAAYVYLKTH